MCVLDRAEPNVITPGTMMEYVKARPFRPFRIHMASGGTFEVRHPEMLRIGRSDMVLFSPSIENADVYDHWNTLSMMLVALVSHLDSPVAS
jgi:hypothetical protein